MSNKKSEMANSLARGIERGKLNKLLPVEEREETKTIIKIEPQAIVQEKPSNLEPIALTTKQEIKESDIKVRSKVKVDKKPDKIPFMTYLERGSHQKFELLHMEVRGEARQTTSKALSQSEMVEVLIEFAKTNANESELVQIAEQIINSRKN